MPLECGVRIKASDLEKFVEPFGGFKTVKDTEKVFPDDMILSAKQAIKAAAMAQKDAHDTRAALVAQAKSFSTPDISKGVEVYCEWKGIGHSDAALANEIKEAEVKGWGRVLAGAAGVLSDRVSCGVRVKDFWLDCTHGEFERLIDASLVGFEESLQKQVREYVNMCSDTSFQDKGFEVYCEVKSMCGG